MSDLAICFIVLCTTILCIVLIVSIDGPKPTVDKDEEEDDETY